MKKNKKIIVQITLIVFMMLVGIFLYSIIRKSFFIVEQKPTVKQEELNMETWITQIDTSIPEETIVYNNISDVVDTDTCEIKDVTWLNSLWYKYIDIFSWEVSNPNTDYRKYTNQFYVQPWFKEAYLCVVANVIPSYQDKKWIFYLWILFNDPAYQWLVNVAYNKSWVLYDYKSKWADKRLTWRMYGLDLKEKDKSYWLNLNSIIVADIKKWFTKISPINRLNLWNQKTLRIWWYISAGTSWIIKKFRIFYKWWFIDNLN